MSAPRVHVYELLNVSKLESLVAITDEDEPALRARLRGAVPVEISRWDLERDEVSVMLHAANLLPQAAREFAALYVENMRHRSWRYRVWPART